MALPSGIHDPFMTEFLASVSGTQLNEYQTRSLADVTREAGADAKTEGQGHARVGRGWLVGACERRVRQRTRGNIDAK
jgi:hypothetical protein